MTTDQYQAFLPDENSMDQKLWDYIDNRLPDAERVMLEKLLAENAEWKHKYNELLEMNRLILDSELEQPSLRFTKNVMEGIAKFHIAPATRKYINSKIIRAIAIFFIAVIAGFLIYGFSQVSVSGTETEGGNFFKNVDYSRMFNNTYVNIFMILNILLALAFLERLLSNKRKEFMKEFKL